MGPGKPGKSWNSALTFSKSGKSWKKTTGPRKILEICLTQVFSLYISECTLKEMIVRL